MVLWTKFPTLSRVFLAFLICVTGFSKDSISIYQVLKDNRDFGFKDQIQRASVSIKNNIAEGFERSSDAEFKRFLFISKGSCGEVRSMLYLAKGLNYITNEEFRRFY